VLPLTDQLLFLAIVGIGCYVQAVTGFALGLVLMAGGAIFGIMSIEMASIVVNMISPWNAGLALARSGCQVRWNRVFAVLAVGVPAILLGLLVLTRLSAENQETLRLLLGITIVASSLTLIRNPRPLARESRGWSFALLGGFAGVLGGMFAAFGPPLIFHFYRQPFALAVIRDSLLMTFLLMSMVRIAMLAAAGMLPLSAVIQAGIAVPVALGFTYLAGRMPQPFGDRGMRRLAFALLMLMGLAVMLPGGA
jgi:uncharacterized membrane protein YfcA